MKKEVCLGTMTARLQRVKRYQAYQLTYNFKRWMISRFKARTKQHLPVKKRKKRVSPPLVVVAVVVSLGFHFVTTHSQSQSQDR